MCSKLSFLTPLIAISISLIPSTASADSNHNADFDDWIAVKNCPDDSRSAKLCDGYYQEPSYIVLEDKKYPLEITSDSGEFINKGDSTFTGNVIAKQGNQSIYADKAIVHHQEDNGELEWIKAFGNFKLTQPGLRVDGNRADLLQNVNQKIIYDAKFRLYQKHARGSAKQINIFDDSKMVLPHATYTTCAPRQNTWRLKARKVKLNKKTGRGQAWHARLHLYKIPVFYWPYINFPIDDRRQTGFLQPSYSHNSKHGDTISAPFYLNLAPNYDATITPHLMSKRKLKLDNQFRYLTGNSYSDIQFNFLPNDKQYKEFRTTSINNPMGVAVTSPKYRGLRDTDLRYGLSVLNHSQLNDNLVLDVNYSRVGDDNYIYDFGSDFKTVNAPEHQRLNSFTASENNSTALEQEIKLTHSSSLGYLTSKVSQYQTLYPFLGPNGQENYRRLPEIDFNSTSFDLTSNFESRFTTNLALFRIKDIPHIETVTTGNRYFLKPEISYHHNNAGWFIKPRVQYQFVNYQNLHLSATDMNAKKPTNASYGVPTYDVDSGLIFERNTKIKDTAYTQTLEPRAFFLYTPKKDQTRLPNFDSGVNTFSYSQIFRDNRYSGYDKISDSQQISLGVFSRFLTDDSFIEKANIGVGRIYYLKDRTPQITETYSTSNKWSPLAITANYLITPHLNLNLNLIREHLNQSSSSSFDLQYAPTSMHVINAGYDFSRSNDVNSASGKNEHIKTTKLSTAWEVMPNLRILGKLDYDLNFKRATDMLAGIEWHSCCTITRVVWRRNLKSVANPLLKENDNSILFQLVLKGFAGTNNLEKSVLQNAISGYNPQDHSF